MRNLRAYTLNPIETSKWKTQHHLTLYPRSSSRIFPGSFFISRLSSISGIGIGIDANASPCWRRLYMHSRSQPRVVEAAALSLIRPGHGLPRSAIFPRPIVRNAPLWNKCDRQIRHELLAALYPVHSRPHFLSCPFSPALWTSILGGESSVAR